MIAKNAHEGQFRSSGEPYITHPVAVAAIIAEMRLDHEAVMAALLHNVIEDTPYTEEQLTKEFGQSVAEIVDGVSKLDKLKFRTRLQDTSVLRCRGKSHGPCHPHNPSNGAIQRRPSHMP